MKRLFYELGSNMEHILLTCQVQDRLLSTEIPNLHVAEKRQGISIHKIRRIICVGI